MTDPSRPVGATPAPPATLVKPLSTRVGFGLAALALVPAGIVVAVIATRPKAPAILDCERYVKTMMVAPATFQWSDETWSEGRAEVTGTLDTHVTSGGLLRVAFRCSMIKNASGNWIVSSGFVDD